MVIVGGLDRRHAVGQNALVDDGVLSAARAKLLPREHQRRVRVTSVHEDDLLEVGDSVADLEDAREVCTVLDEARARRALVQDGRDLLASSMLVRTIGRPHLGIRSATGFACNSAVL